MPQIDFIHLILVNNWGANINSLGGISVDSFGRTNIQGVYMTGYASVINPVKIIIVACLRGSSGGGCKY